MRWAFLSVLCIACSGPDKGPKDLEDPVTSSGTLPDATAIAELSKFEAAPHSEYGSVIVVQWTQSQTATVHVEFTFDNEGWRSSPERRVGAGPHQEVLLGIPFNQDVRWRLVADNALGMATSEDMEVATTSPPSNMPRPELLVSQPDRWDDGLDYVLVSVSYDDQFWGPTMVQVLDRLGRVVWAHRTPSDRVTMHPRLTVDGTSFLLDYGGHWSREIGRSDLSTVVALNIDGSIDREWDTPGLYHAFTQLPDASLAYSRQRNADLDGDLRGDGDALMIAREGGGLEELFNCDAWLQDAECGTNTVSFDATRNVFLYSLFTVDTVLEIDADSGQVKNWFGDVPGGWSFDPPSSQFWYQHGGHFTDDGTLLISTHSVEEAPDEARVELATREYQVDDTNRTLRQIWSAGVGLGVVGRQMGEAHRLPNGNTLHNHGTHAVLREFAADGEVVWDVRWEGMEYSDIEEGHAIGRSVPITGDLYPFAPPRL